MVNKHAPFQAVWRCVVAGLCLTGGSDLRPASNPDPDPRRDTTVTVVDRVMPSVVNIRADTVVEYRDPFEDLLREFWGPYYRRRPNTQYSYSLGSGVIIDETGYVLTNLHVVRRANRIRVILHDGREYDAEPVVGTTLTDVALLKLKAKPGEKFTAVRFARDDDLLLGETVLALGNPFGLGGSVSRGILSSKNRRPPREDEPLDVADWLQTDAAINPGNSGGPLINLRAELIGLNVAVYREGQGIGFAIPARRVAEALSEIFTPELLHSLWFGARVKAGANPLQVSSVQPGSPAEKSGLSVGDRILQVRGQSPKDIAQFCESLSAGERGDVPLRVQRGNEQRSLTVRLLPLSELIRQKLGATLQELTRELAQGLGINPDSGLLVAGLDQDGPAERAELQRGNLIAGMDGQKTPDLATAASILAARKSGETLRLTVVARRQRGVATHYLEGTVNVRVR